MGKLDTEQLAKLAFQLHGLQVGGKTQDGKPWPTWDSLTPLAKSAWEVSAIGVASRVAVVFGIERRP